MRRRAIGKSAGTGDAGKDGNRSRRRDFANHVVAGVAHKKIAMGVKGQPAGRIELRIRAGFVRRAGNAGLAGEGRHRAVRSDFADGIVLRISHEEISINVRGDGGRVIEQRVGARAVRRAADERLAGQQRHGILRLK